MKVSVCIPVYNVENYIERCARSLFGQTMKDGIEFIFVDDCSQDASVSILKSVLKEYHDRADQVKIIKQDRNLGSAAARQAAWSAASGKYVMHCDSDDWMSSEMCAQMVDMAESSDADVVCCSYALDYGNGNEKPLQLFYPTDGHECVRRLCGNWALASLWNKCVRREVLTAVRPLPGVSQTEDLAVCVSILLKCNRVASITNGCFYHYCQNAGSMSSKLTDAAFEDFRRVRRFLTDVVPPKMVLDVCNAYDVIVRVVSVLRTDYGRREFRQIKRDFPIQGIWARDTPTNYRVVLSLAMVDVRFARGVYRFLRWLRGEMSFRRTGGR